MSTYPCENCGAPIEVRPRELVLICRECGYEQRLSGVDPTVDAPFKNLPPVSNGEPLEPIVPKPRGIKVDDDGYRLRIRRRWFGPQYIFLLFFCIAWDAFLVFWYSMAFQVDAPWIMVVFPIAHVAVGVGLTYFVLAGLLNTTTITADPQELMVRHRPIPWRGNVKYAASQIRQLYVKRDKAEVNGSKTFSLYALLLNRKAVKLLSGLLEPSQGQFIEQEIERHLGIAPEAVKGEV
jgi:hypothetical protein